MSAPLEMILARLDGVVQQNGHFMARCPAHADRNPSLQITPGDQGAILLKCFAGCETVDILRALDLEWKDLFQPRAPIPPAAVKRVVATTNYRIRDRIGNLVATHTRVDYSNGTKDVTWPRGTRPKELPLYGIHERRDDHTTVVVVEGEKARDALDPLTPHNILVVGTVCGAGATPSLDTLSDLAGLDVVLWPDNDDPGRRHMERIAALLAQPPQWIGWLDAPSTGDAADWIAAGATSADVKCMIEASYPDGKTGPMVLSDAYRIYASDETSERRDDSDSSRPFLFPVANGVDLLTDSPAETDWIAKPWIVRGEITKLDGAPKAAGKTTFALAMARSILDGAPFLGEATTKGPVLLISEQGASSLRSACERAGLLGREDFHYVLYHHLTLYSWEQIAPEAFRIAQSLGCVLIIFDTLPATAKVPGDDENSAGVARATIDVLRNQLAAYGCGVLLIFHDRKSGGEVGESGRGSSAYAGAVDIVLQLTRVGGEGRPEVRRIATLSRYPETPPETFIAYHDGSYDLIGDRGDIAALEMRVALRDVLPTESAQAIPVDDRKTSGEIGIISRLKDNGCKATRSTVYLVLAEMQRSREIFVTGEGKPRHPLRYWRHEFHLSDAPSMGSQSDESNSEVSSDDHVASDETLSAEQTRSFWGELS